jgi:C4-dicarboxylate transporter, DctM subunit
MDAVTTALIMVGGLLILMAIGVEIAVAMGVMASLGFIFILDHSQLEIAYAAWGQLNSFNLMAMPLFIFMGTMFANTGVVRSLFEGADKWLGRLPGGLVSSVLTSSAFFGAMSGSSIAAAATFSTIAFPEMEKRGYNPELSLGAIAAGGTLSVLIPPSIILIIYGAWENQSVARLFAAALIPGIILSILFIITVAVIVMLYPGKVPKPANVTWKERFSSVRGLIPWIFIIGLILGVIFGGLMTPTEASALGATLSVITALAYRQMSYKALRDSALQAVKIAGMIGFILFTAKLLAFVLQSAGLTEAFANFMQTLPIGKYATFAVIMVMYLILGMFFDATAMLLLTMPFVMPVMLNLGFDPIWFGVVYVIVAEIGMVTPPFGLNLFTIHSVLPKYSVIRIAKGALPFLIPMIIIIIILTIFPDLALWLPSVLYQ